MNCIEIFTEMSELTLKLPPPKYRFYGGMASFIYCQQCNK